MSFNVKIGLTKERKIKSVRSDNQFLVGGRECSLNSFSDSRDGRNVSTPSQGTICF